MKKRIMQYCKKNWFTKGSCISVVFGPPTSVMGSAIYDSLKNSDDIEKSAVKYVIIVVEKSPEKPKTKLNGKDNKDDLKNNPKKSEPEKKKSAPTPVLGLTTEDIKKISKNTCIANAKNRLELREIPINSLVLTDKSDGKIMYEWRIKKGEKTICIFYVKTLGTVIY